jgi:hypothetical protein
MNKKISLGSIQGKLTRAEMKNVLGGMAQVTCSWSWASGYTGDKTTSCTGTADGCQAAADNWCWSHDSCTNVDCV